MRNTLLISGLCIGLAACSQTGGEVPPASSAPVPVEPSPGQTCNTSLVDKIGEPVASAGVPNNRNFRIVQPNSIITQDFVETRTNIELNEDGTIKSVYCG